MTPEPLSPPEPHEPAPSSRPWPYALAVLLLPALVLWYRDSALYPPAWYGDAWFYTGFFRHLAEYKRHLFYGVYYGGRLGWVVPGAAAHSLLPAVAANLGLRLLVHSVAALSLFSLLRRLRGERAAWLGTMVFSANPWVWAAFGWDYPDGAGIAYCLLALALLTRWAWMEGAGWTAAGAGAALAALAYTHIFWISLVPVLAGYGVALAWAWHGRPGWRRAVELPVGGGAGAAAVSALLAAVNYRLDGNIWFYSSSVRQALEMSREFRFVKPLTDPGGSLAAWLWPAAAALCAAMLSLGVKIRNGRVATPAAIVCGLFLAPLAWMGWLQYRGNTVLGHHPYASDLLPAVFVVFGAVFWEGTARMSRRGYVLLCAGLAVGLAAMWQNMAGSPGGHFLAEWPEGQRAALWISILCLGAGLWWRRRRAGAIAAAAGFVAFTGLNAGRTNFLDGVDVHGNRAQWERIIGAGDRIEALRGGGPVRFWYDREEPGFHEYNGLNALYLSEFNRISEQFPRGCAGPAPPGTLIVVTSVREDAMEAARAALGECWGPWGMYAEPARAERVARPGRPYVLAFLRARVDAAHRLPVRALFGPDGAGTLEAGDRAQPLPASRWLIRHGDIRREGERLVVKTVTAPNGTAAEYPVLRAAFSGWYRVSIGCRDVTGAFAFHAIAARTGKTLGIDGLGYRAGDRHEKELWLQLRAGDEFVLLLQNNDVAGRGASRFTLEDLTITAVPSPAGD